MGNMLEHARKSGLHEKLGQRSKSVSKIHKYFKGTNAYFIGKFDYSIGMHRNLKIFN